MKKVWVSDVSFRMFEEQKKALSFREKLNVAQLLDRAGVDAIELPRVQNEKEDIVILRTIADTVQTARICADGGSTVETVALAWEGIKGGKSSCIQIVLPTSTVQMEYLYHLKAPSMLEKIKELCGYAASLCPCVEFVAQDASRAEKGFLTECAKAAKESGAQAITLCDDSGICFPEDMAALVKEIKAACDILVFVQPSNALKLAAACAVQAIKAGADGVKTAVCKGALHANALADIFRAKEGALALSCGLDITGIHHLISQIYHVDCVTDDAELPENTEMKLTADSTLADISAAVKGLGYELSDVDNGNVFEEFKRVIVKKEEIGTKELDAIVASSAMQVPSTFHLISYVVNSGNILEATANVTLEKNGEKLSGVSTGSGPIDAAFHAIEQIVGFAYELDDFQVQAVTKGREAVGSSLIRLRADGKLVSGNGVSTDIIGACIRAYVNALNKIVYEEK